MFTVYVLHVFALHVKDPYTGKKEKTKEKNTLVSIQAALKVKQSGVGFDRLKVMSTSLFNFTQLDS